MLELVDLGSGEVFTADTVLGEEEERLLGPGFDRLLDDDQVIEVGLFFVEKKNMSLRLTGGGKVSNFHFRSPWPVRLATGDTLSHLEL